MSSADGSRHEPPETTAGPLLEAGAWLTGACAGGADAGAWADEAEPGAGWGAWDGACKPRALALASGGN